jgi:hypothetical protein
MTLLLEQELQLVLSRGPTLQGASQCFAEEGNEQGYDGEDHESDEMSYGVGSPIKLRSHSENA